MSQIATLQPTTLVNSGSFDKVPLGGERKWELYHNFVVVGLDGQTVDQYQAPTTRHCRENEKPWQARD